MRHRKRTILWSIYLWDAPQNLDTWYFRWLGPPLLPPIHFSSPTARCPWSLRSPAAATRGAACRPRHPCGGARPPPPPEEHPPSSPPTPSTAPAAALSNPSESATASTGERGGGGPRPPKHQEEEAHTHVPRRLRCSPGLPPLPSPSTRYVSPSIVKNFHSLHMMKLCVCGR